MKPALIPLAALSVSLLVSSSAMRAQAPQAPNPGVQVLAPQGNAQDQAEAQARQAQQQAARAKLAGQPAPRTADGRIVLGNTKTIKGLWVGGGLGFCNANRVTPPASLNPGLGRAGADGGRAAGAASAPAPAGAAGGARAAGPGGRAGGAGGGRAGGRGAAAPCTPVPYMEWTLAVSDDRRVNELEPHTRCKPSGGPRQWLTPYGAEFLELPDQKLAFIFDVGGPHTYRTIYMDGRTHPKGELPLYYGHSVGWWEGDTLVVDTTNYNESFWLDRRGVPHTEQLHTIEKFTRTSAGTIKYDVTIDDPGAYTKPWSATFDLRRENGQELFEYICQQANYAHELMVGTEESVDRSTTIVP